MSLPSYPELARKIREKTRGRTFELKINDSPELWAKFRDANLVGDIQVWFEGNYHSVATLREDNSVTIDIHGWHTQPSVKIIEALTGDRCCVSKNHIWVGRYPVDGPIEFDCNRYLVRPEKFVALEAGALANLVMVTLDDLPPKHRMMYELGTWHPEGAITQSVKDYARGKIPKSQLSPRDILTIVSGCHTHVIIGRLFAEAV
jgi:hypothetical protein